MPDLQWLLLALPAAFALGWLASRLDLRQMRREQRDDPRPFFKGLNLLLNEQQDKAIDAFIEAVQKDPETAELHFALGSLFRRRGEFERAVRVHEHLLSRADLKPQDRQRAQRALAQDFMRAGLFDRAEAAWRRLEGTAFADEARLALLALHERARDWTAASAVAEELQRGGLGSFGARIAHYQCELAIQFDAQGDATAADAALDRARAASPTSARPWVLRGQRLAARQRHAEAMAAWDELRRVQPQAFGLVALAYADSARQAGRSDVALQALDEAYAAGPSMALLQARSTLDDDPTRTTQALVAHTRRLPTLSAARALLALPVQAWGEDGLTALRAAVDHAARQTRRHRCAACGFEAQHWFWQCPGCLGWDTFPPLPLEEC